LSADFDTANQVNWAALRLSVIVVSYNTRDFLRRCLASLGQEHEIIVVDNASVDGSLEMVREEFPWVVLIANDINLGFGAANNQGFDVMTGELALLLNSDAYATAGSIEELLGAMDDQTVVAAGGRLVNAGTEFAFSSVQFHEHLTLGRALPPAGFPESRVRSLAQLVSTQNSCATRLTIWAVFCEQTMLEKAFPMNPILSPYWQTRRILNGRSSPFTVHATPQTFPVEQVMGACLMMRPVERFDERFFLYCEDTELCLRLRHHGRIVHVPDAVFGHELGASSTSTRWESVARYNWGKELYFAIHHGKGTAFLCWCLNRMGAMMRLSAWGLLSLGTLFLRPSLRRKSALFARVLFAPIQGPPRPN